MIIYKHTSKTSRKSYIGQTTKTLDERWKTHIQSANRNEPWVFQRAIRKYGVDDFIHEIIEDNIIDNKTLDEREQYWIQYYDTFNNGYNMDTGGNMNRTYSEDARKKLSTKLTKPYFDKELNEWTTIAKVGSEKSADTRTKPYFDKELNEWTTIAKKVGMKNKEILSKPYFDEELNEWTTIAKKAGSKYSKNKDVLFIDKNGVETTISKKISDGVKKYKKEIIYDDISNSYITLGKKNSLKAAETRWHLGKSRLFNLLYKNKLVLEKLSFRKIYKEHKKNLYSNIDKNLIYTKNEDYILIELFYIP